MLQKVRKTIENHRMLSEGERVLVGFSGGIDSVCLLHVLSQLKEYRLDLWAVYIDHMLRPSENLREVELLHKLGAEWGVKVREIKLDIPGKLLKKPQSLQLLARKERYKLFISLRDEIKASKIALGHHQDDQVETILYRLMRGTGIDGLAGIPFVRDGFFIRPLLEVSRAEIREYALRNKLNWVEDSSNQKPVYIRNKLRLELIPELKKSYNPNLNSALLRLARLACEQRELMEALLTEKWEKLTLNREGRTGIIIEEFLKLPSYLQYYLLKTVLQRTQPERQYESTALIRLRGKINAEKLDFKPLQLSKTVIAHKLEGAIFFDKAKQKMQLNAKSFRLNTPGVTVIPELNLEVRIEKGHFVQDWEKIGPNEVYLDGAGLSVPFYLRFWRYGDSFHPLGAPGNQKLHDFFINRKIPREKRTEIPLLVTSDDKIVWIRGYRLSETFKVKGKNAEVWHVSLIPIPRT